MKPQDAIVLLAQACQSVQTNWEGHMKLQEALKTLSALIPSEPKDVVPPTEKQIAANSDEA